jgi:thiol-disulfide isomerase/thioredoxin
MFISIGLGVVIAVALIVVVSILTGGKVTGGNTPKSALVGTHIKSFSLDGLSSGTEKSPWSSGHASVLIFFASWCGPCQKEMPKVAAYVAAHDPSPVVVLGMDSNDQRGPAKAFIKKSDVTFPVAFDALGQVASEDFGFQSLPETVFLNKKGVVTDVYVGAIPTKQLRAGIKSLQTA